MSYSALDRRLSESWENGSAIQGTWRMHKDDALSKVLAGDWKSLSSLRKRVRQAASTLARAMESIDPTLSTLFSVVALETLLRDGSSSFKETEAMASCIFEGPFGAPEISRLFSNRHEAAHEAKAPDGAAQHSREIAAAWGIILLAALASAELSSVAQFLEHLRGRVFARRVAEQLRKNDRSELADEVERAATFLTKPANKK